AEPLRTKIHAAPTAELSAEPPTMAVLPSADNATEVPWPAAPPAAVPTNFEPCCVHVEPLRTKIHAAPALASSEEPPTMAVLPPAESATARPCSAAPPAPLPISFDPCCVHVAPLRVNTHVAPVLPSSKWPPTSAVLPSDDSDTDAPCVAAPVAPVPTSFDPCCVNWAKAAPDERNEAPTSVTTAV